MNVTKPALKEFRMSPPKVQMTLEVNPQPVAFDTVERKVHVELRLKAPDLAAGVASRPLNLGLVIDRSGSMKGDKIEAAKAAATRVVQRMADHDVFALVAFSGEPETLVKASQVGLNRQNILGLIQNLQAGGSTYFCKALRAAASEIRPHAKAEANSAFYVLTDGKVDDPQECLAFVPDVHQAGIAIYGGGIGDDYQREFLFQICDDPFEKGNKRFLVDHVKLSELQTMATAFEQFLALRGHVVTANCRLSIECPPMRVRLFGATTKEHTRKLTFDAQHTATLPDLPAGQEHAYWIEFVVKPDIEQTILLARFRLRYDLPTASVKQAETVETVHLEITRDPLRANTVNPKVEKLIREIQAVQMMASATADLEKKDVRGATKKLRGTTKIFKDLGMEQKAQEVEEQADAIEQSAPEQLDRHANELRGKTKRFSE
jgi:hypothetical protein